MRPFLRLRKRSLLDGVETHLCVIRGECVNLNKWFLSLSVIFSSSLSKYFTKGNLCWHIQRKKEVTGIITLVFHTRTLRLQGTKRFSQVTCYVRDKAKIRFQCGYSKSRINLLSSHTKSVSFLMTETVSAESWWWIAFLWDTEVGTGEWGWWW